VQVKVDRVHVQPVPEIAVTVKLVGGSVTVTIPLVAAEPTALETVIEYDAPACPGLTLPTLDTAAVRVGVVGAGGVLLLLLDVHPATKRRLRTTQIPNRADAKRLNDREGLGIAAILWQAETRSPRAAGQAEIYA